MGHSRAALVRALRGHPRILFLTLLAGLLGCSGDAQVFRVPPPAPSDLALGAHGLQPSDPGPAADAIAFARARGATSVRLRLARVPQAQVDAPEFDPAELDYDSVALGAVGGPPDALGFRRWEGPLPLRAENEALLYFFEAFDDRGDRRAAPEAGAAGATVLGARPVEIDFPWPAWPSPPEEIVCRADVGRVFDGAEDEATLGGGAPFEIVREPVFVRASRATVHLNRAGVSRGVGVEMGGEAYFFPLVVMLWTETSNQSVGDLRSVVSYCPLTDTAVHFDTGLDPAALPKFHDYAPAGLFNSNLSIGIEGRRPGESTAYNQMLGFGITGPERGRCLDVLPSILVEFDTWTALHPDSWVLHGDDDGGDRFDYAERDNPYEQYWIDDDEIRSAIARTDPRLARKARVMGLLGPGDPVAVELPARDFVHHTESASLPVVVLQQRRTAIALVRRHPLTGETLRLRPTRATWRGSTLYEDDTAEPSRWSFEGVAVSGPAAGERLAWMPSMSAFWFAWYAIYPECTLETPETGP